MGKQSSKLAPADLADLKENTTFTEEEIHQWYEGFIKVSHLYRFLLYNCFVSRIVQVASSQLKSSSLSIVSYFHKEVHQNLQSMFLGHLMLTKVSP